MLAHKSNNEEIARLYSEFSKKYRSKYPQHTWGFIEENFWTYVYSNTAPDILMQIYSEMGLESPKGNFYKEHIKRLKERFDIGCNILDIGSGMIPSFANLLAHEQLRISKGTITLYEPLLLDINPKHKNMTLYKHDFTSQINIQKFDLITSILPCEATELVISQACKNKIDFYVAMCGCVHFDHVQWDVYITPEIYQNHVIAQAQQLIKENNMGELIVERLDNNYDIDYPILYNRKK